MTNSAAIVLAAGLGTRMKSKMPKVMHPLAGRPMVKHVIASLEETGISKICCVVGPDMENLQNLVAPHPSAVQTERLGTAHAVLAARSFMEDFKGPVLIAYGDTPMISTETFKDMLDAAQSNDVVVLGFTPRDPGAYGRLVVDPSKELQAIVEYKDATAEQRAITLCNSGVMCVNGEKLFHLLDRISNDNAAGEYYLTDIVALARSENLRCTVVEGHEQELIGVNSRLELAQAETLVQDKLRIKAMTNGATLLDPATTYFSFDTEIGQDVLIEPNVFFGPEVKIEDNATIKAFSHLEGAHVGRHSVIGPYARLRPGSTLKDNAKIGNFVELKKTVIEAGAKVNHLSYIGDAHVGENANIGAGTITCNYDGFFKYKTTIGAGAFIGSNTALVAPVRIGDNATVGAGSTVSKNIENGALGLTRAKQKNYDGWADAFRTKQQALKDKE